MRHHYTLEHHELVFAVTEWVKKMKPSLEIESISFEKHPPLPEQNYTVHSQFSATITINE
jgi:hypothetical protein